jgi:anthranilate synthase/aminodeoxychorismate synthase-like glutamine amidotransferase
MIVLLDNYDSFTWNVEAALSACGVQVRVIRNDAHSAAELLELGPRALVLSPGPGRPSQAGIQPELLRLSPPELPILGVCLGHQGLVEHYGGRVVRDAAPVHGRASAVRHSGSGLFEGAPDPLVCGRYHSLIAERESLPDCLRLTAWTEDGLVMAVEHRELPRFGVQFHPESVLSPDCRVLFENFLRRSQE